LLDHDLAEPLDTVAAKVASRQSLRLHESGPGGDGSTRTVFSNAASERQQASRAMCTRGWRSELVVAHTLRESVNMRPSRRQNRFGEAETIIINAFVF
jgi:hypothetical protein